MSFLYQDTIFSHTDMQRRFGNSYIKATISGIDYCINLIEFMSEGSNVAINAAKLPTVSQNLLPGLPAPKYSSAVISWETLKNITTIHSPGMFVLHRGVIIQPFRVPARRTREGISSDTYGFTTLTGGLTNIDLAGHIAYQLLSPPPRLPTVNESKEYLLKGSTSYVPLTADIILSSSIVENKSIHALQINDNTVALLIGNNLALVTKEGLDYLPELEKLGLNLNITILNEESGNV